MMLKQNFVTSVIYLYFFYFCSSQNSESLHQKARCNLSELKPLNVVSCDDDFIKSDEPDSSLLQISVGASCIFAENQTSSTVLRHCGPHGWHSTDVENAVAKSKDVVFYSHGGRVKRFFGLLIAGIIGIVGLASLFACPHAKRDRDKPNMVCETVPSKLADPIQTNTHVTWNEPIAHDNVDGKIIPRRHGLAPGRLFSEGTHCVRYIAKDRAGNYRECCVNIKVKVKRCPRVTPISDGYFQCHPSSDLVQGTTCHFGCYRGHKLIGNPTLTCIGHNDNNQGKWSSHQPKCERLQCTKLPPQTKPMHMRCTDKNYYRSICTFSCDEGYDIVEGQTRVMLCTEYGTWRGSVPKCRDSQPPVMKSCNSYQIGFTDRGSDSGKLLKFEVPEVDDNVDHNIQPLVKSKTNPQDRLQAGVYEILYSATDDAGNKAQMCKIKLVMKMITCPRIYPTADSYVTCDTGSRYGSNCEFSCDSSAVLNGSSHVTCDKKDDLPYGYWNWGNHQPFCQNAKRCLQNLNTPEHGAIACDYWLGGKFCHMFCRDKYDIPRSSALLGNGNSMFVCGESGMWSPSASVPNCIRVIGGSHVNYRLNIEFHFAGNCHDADVVEEIKEQFILTWKSSGYQEACIHEVEKCTPSNIQVRCGMSHGKRSTNLQLVFDVQIGGLGIIESDTFTNMSLTQFSAIQRLRDSLKNGNLNFEINNITLSAVDLTYTNVKLQCTEGMVLTNNKKNCAKCGQGTFYEKIHKTCEPCPRGTFQPAEGQLTCLQCPHGKTTRRIRSANLDNCEDACPPGSWSIDGIPPCNFCPKGAFQQSYGGNECTECPSSTTTEFDGSKEQAECKAFDVVFLSSPSFIEKDIQFPDHTNFTLGLWIMVDKVQDTAHIITLNMSDKSTLEISIQNGGIAFGMADSQTITLEKLEISKWYSLVLTVSTDSMSLFLNGEEFHTSNTYDWYLSEDSGKIRLGDGFTGRISQLNVFSDYRVFSEYGMPKCVMNKTGDILGWKSFESILDRDVLVDVPSDCDDTNECDSGPCLNGNCTDELNGYSCQCFYGFYGDNCENNIDDCSDNACDNNGTCIDDAASYTCACEYGFTGELCEVKMVDGEWSEWSNWTSCSVTCGNGTMSRKRLCNDPTPDNGGLDCVGDNMEYSSCMDEECTFCSPLIEPENTILICDNDTVTDTINCTLQCKPGHKFDHDAKYFYYCGPETLHLWDIESDDNPLTRLPSCTELKNATLLEIHYSGTYDNLICDKSASVEIVENKVRSTVTNASVKTSCISDNTCQISKLDILNCSDSKREKRDTPTVEAGFRINLKCDATEHGSDECHALLMDAFENLVQQTEASNLDSEIDKIVYPINRGSLRIDSTVTCEDGMVPVDYRCVPCSKGRYLHNGACQLCDVGSYQNNPGSRFCFTCPEGRSTLGKGSVSEYDCSVKKDILKDAVNGMLLGVGCALAVVLLVLIVLIIRREQMKKKRKVVDYNFKGAKSHYFAPKAVFDKHELYGFKRKHNNSTN